MPSMVGYSADSWIEVTYNSDGTLKDTRNNNSYRFSAAATSVISR